MAPLKLNGSSSGFTAVEAPASAGSNTLTLPASNGSANQYLKNSGTPGVLEFATLDATPEGTAIKSTGETGGTKFLREDGDGTCSWQAAGGGGGASNLEFTATGVGVTWTANSSTGYIKANTASGNDMEFNVGGNLNHYRFKFGTTEKMRWHSNSTVVWGASPSTSASYDTTQGIWWHGGAYAPADIVVGTQTVSAAGLCLILNRSDDGTGNVAIFRKAGSSKGSISIDGSSTAYNTSSDYRLKQDEVLISDGITRLKKLKPYRFKWKADTSRTVDGFFAHEVTPAVPEAIFGEKDAMKGETFYEEGDTLPSGKKVGDVKTYSSSEIDAQQIDQSKLVPLLTAALQEAISKIETLETKVAALEAA